jgi:outer membrane autotransporter protein
MGRPAQGAPSTAAMRKGFRNGAFRNKKHTIAVLAYIFLAAGEVSAFANPINNDLAFQANTLGRGDDVSRGPIPLGFSINYSGTTYIDTYVGNNGYITFGRPFVGFLPFALTGSVTTPIIAPFFADVDTTVAGSPVTYGTGTVNGNAAFGVNWFDVDYFPSSLQHTNRNTFQLLLVSRPDTGAGNFDIFYNYGQIQWETAGGPDGCAVAGYSGGTRAPRPFTSAQINGSLVCGSFIDGGVNALATNTNNGTPGQFFFPIRNQYIDLAQPFYLASNLVSTVFPVFQGGTLQINTSGTYTDNFTLNTSATNTIDARGNTANFSGVFSNETARGNIVIADSVGGGSIIFSGSNTYTGLTTVQAGTLWLQGVMRTSAITVASGATLRGAGTVVGDVVISNGGTLSPGNSPGALTVAGNVTMSAGATYSADIDGGSYSAFGGAGSYDRLRLIGASSVFSAAGTLSPKLRGITGAATNSYTPSIGDTFKIVTANTIAGNFSSVSQPTTGMLPNSRFDVLYNTSDIELVVTPESYKQLAQTAGARLNVVNIAGVLDAGRPAAGSRATGDLGNLFNDIYGLKSGQLPAALESLGGEIHADLVVSSLDNRRLGRATAMKRLSSARTDLAKDDSNVWVQLISRTEYVNADLVAGGYSNRAYGYAFGGDYLITDNLRLGLGHANVSSVVNAGTSGIARDNSKQVFVYGSWEPAADYFIDADIAYGWNGYNIQRSVALRTGTYSYSSHDKTYNWAADMSFGRRFMADGYIIEPSMGIRWDQMNRGAVSETGNSIAALSLTAKQDESVQGKAGVSLSRAFPDGDLEWVPEVHGYFLPRLSGNAMFIQRAKIAGLNIATSSVQDSSGSALLGSGVRLNLSSTAHLFLDYDAQLQGSQSAIHSVSGGLNVNF